MTDPVPTTRGPVDVWAPDATSVELQLDDARHEMTRTTGGWWTADVGTAGELDGRRYGYRIDGDDRLLPDPRSRRQPDGVHEASAVYDQTSYAWQDSAWHGRPLAGGVVYELHIGTFTPEGTFEAAASRLDHLVELGIDFVEILPVNDFNGRWNWGYDGVLWYAVHELYGGPAGYQAFVDACHRAGIGVIQDVVYNHLGASGNYLPEFGPYLVDKSSNTWGLSVNLDGPQSDEVRRFIVDNALMWLTDYHVDGLRLDAVHALVDTRAVHILEQLATETADAAAAVGRPLTLIAESDMNDPSLITAREAGGDGLDAQWSDDFHHAVHANLTGESNGYYADFASIDALAKVFSRGFFHDGTYSSFRKRSHGRPIDTLRMPTSRLVVFSQDHDQIGNRAEGDRLSASLDTDRLAIAAALVILSPFTPMLFMGEEWGASTPWQFFTSHPEPELGEATAKGRIEEFVEMGWDESVVPDPQDPETFERSKLDWSEVDRGEHGDLLGLYRRLLALRKAYPAFTDQHLDRVQVEWDPDARWIAVRRGDTLLAANLGTEPAPIAADVAAALEQRGEVAIDGASVRLGAHAMLVALVR